MCKSGCAAVLSLLSLVDHLLKERARTRNHLLTWLQQIGRVGQGVGVRMRGVMQAALRTGIYNLYIITINLSSQSVNCTIQKCG